MNTTVQLVPDKAFYHPGETVHLDVTATSGARVDVQITYLDEAVATLTAPIADGRAAIEWTPPETAPRGYGLTASIYEESGELLATRSAAFDVLERWTDAPRYGFLTDFSAARDNDAATADWLLRHHINGLQFYDWQYRWEDLLPASDEFDDGLGRPQSMVTIRRLIDLAHRLNIAAMPYTAIYGASFAFYRQHEDWSLFDASGETYLFGDNFIAIMNPALGSPWNQHLMSEFADVLDNTAFDGIHIDQYGSPKMGFDAAGNRVDLAEVMPQFANQTAELVDEKRGDDGAVLFNAVGNWPIDTLAPSDVDAAYIEVWPPNNDYLDLNRIITNAQEVGGGKPVILAAYIPPERAINWRLANAIIFASGGYHIETGEPGTMLADPYFPRFGEIPEDQEAVFERYYDFLVRYENVLALGTSAASHDRQGEIDMGDIRTRALRSRDRVAPIIRVGSTFETLNFVNFMGIDGADWNAPTNVPPTPFTDVQVSIPVTREVESVWFASPDDPETMSASPVPFAVEDGTLRLSLPRLTYWSMLLVEYADVP